MCYLSLIEIDERLFTFKLSHMDEFVRNHLFFFQLEKTCQLELKEQGLLFLLLVEQEDFLSKRRKAKKAKANLLSQVHKVKVTHTHTSPFGINLGLNSVIAIYSIKIHLGNSHVVCSPLLSLFTNPPNTTRDIYALSALSLNTCIPSIFIAILSQAQIYYRRMWYSESIRANITL